MLPFVTIVHFWFEKQEKWIGKDIKITKKKSHHYGHMVFFYVFLQNFFQILQNGHFMHVQNAIVTVHFRTKVFFAFLATYYFLSYYAVKMKNTKNRSVKFTEVLYHYYYYYFYYNRQLDGANCQILLYFYPFQLWDLQQQLQVFQALLKIIE